MSEKDKTIYLWDLAGTLFYEKWDKEKTGAESFEKWIEGKLNKKVADISPREYEEMQYEPYTNDLYLGLNIQPGFEEILSWTGHNETFSTGNPEQVEWRAEALQKKLGIDIRGYFQALNSTFDYGETNIKTEKMIAQYLDSKYKKGFKTIVYTDDKIENVDFFKKAAMNFKKLYSDFDFRLYHMLNDDSEIKDKSDYWEAGNLLEVLKNEKNINEN